MKIKDILRIKGASRVQEYLVEAIQEVYQVQDQFGSPSSSRSNENENFKDNKGMRKKR